MKRLLLLSIVICSLCGYAFSQNGRIPLTPSAQKSGTLLSNSMTGFSTTFSFNSIESQSISNEKGEFSEIYIDGSFPYGEVGSPSLPMITRMIAIPEGATPVVTVNGYSESEYALADYDINTLSAQQSPIRKSIDPTTVEYVVNHAAYASDAYTADEIASVEYLGTMRGIRIGKLTVRPVSYNAAANTIKVRNDINVSVDFENANAALTQSIFASTYSPAFNSIYDQLLNKSIFGSNTRSAYTDHPDLYNTPVRMLVICYSGFRGDASLNQWLAWKLQKGYYVDIFYTDETGTTASAIASFIRTKYNASVAAGNAYTYLITIGDTRQVPQYATENVDEQCATDLGYSSVDSDYFPDMFYSRISVENATHLSNYVDKVLTYEKYQMSDGGNYLNNLILVGGWDSSWTSRVARPTVNYGSTNYFNTSNTTYGGFENGTLNITISTSSTAGYSGTNNGCYNGINNGACFVNYTAHGDKQEWYQPKLSATQVATLTNNGKYFFGVGNCCLTGNFNNTTTDYSPGSAIGDSACFAETMIRVPKAGAVAYVGCSPYSYWYEDFYWAVGAHTYSQGNAPSTSASTMGVYDAMFVDDYWNSASSLLYLGNLAVQQAVSSNNTNSSVTDGNCSNSANYYFKFYHTFGDGSVMPYITKPEANTVTLPSSVTTGETSMTVNAVAGSYVAVTDNESTIYGVAVANSSGVATVTFSEAIPASGTLYVVVTRQQYQPYFGTVSVVAPYPPVADFTGTPTTILERESVTFTNNSQYAASYLWNFGDGQTSTEANPVHTYMTPGTYTVSLQVVNPLGNDTKTRTDYITVNANTNPPVVDFVASETEISVGTTITFTDLTENIVTSWSWEFEGGTPATSTEQNPTVTYDEPGEYTVTLTATNAYGSDVETKVDYITVLYPEINMSNATITTCGGIYRDPGGTSNYGNNANYTQTIYPSTDGAMVRLTFTSFSLQAGTSGWGGTTTCNDKFYIYDGTSTSATALVDGVCGTSNPGTITATNSDGALTIVFTSNNRTVSSGWEAEISCYIPDAEVAVQSYTPATARYNTTNDLTVTFVNQGGRATSANTTATLSTTDEYLTLNSNTTILGAIARNATADGTFNFSLAENVPDGHVATINVAITDGSSTWNETLTITAVGPACDAPTGLQVAVEGTSATITWDEYTVINNTISDDFEGHTHGTINSAGTVGWTYIDSDNTATGTFSTIEFTNEGSKMAFIALDVDQVELTNTNATALTAHSGNKILGSPFISSRVANNDWIISPELNFSESFTFSFYARSASSSYSNEQFYAAYSTTGNLANDFINLNTSATATTTDWTEYTYTVPANAKYVAIHCVSSDQFMFCIDDITISEIIESGSEFVNIYDNGVLIASNVTTGTYTANNLSDGEHCFSIRAVCDDDSESLAAQSCVTINSNIPSYTVTVNANNGGNVNPSGVQTVYEGSDFTFTVTPNDCYELASVTVDGNNVDLTNNQYTISNVTSNHTVNVTFSQISYEITASAGNGGTINNAPSSVNCGEEYTFTVTPETCYEVATVTVNGTPITPVNDIYTVSNVTSPQNINATFTQISYAITTSSSNGTIEAPSSVNCGEEYTFTVTPETCYEVTSVTVNGTPVTPTNNVYTISNVTAAQNIVATFRQISYEITASAGNGGTINNAPSSVNCGGEYTFTVTPETCYEVVSVTVNGTPVTPINDIYTISNVTAAQNIAATFSQISYAITTSALNGTIEAPSSVNCGEEYTFTVTPETCYEVVSVTVNGTPITPINNVYTVSNVTAPQNIAATFSQISYTITASAGNGGTITPAGDVSVNCGEGQTFTIAATEGYMISAVLVDGQNVGSMSSYTFSNVTATHTISVTFEEIPAGQIVVVVNADTESGSVTPTGTQTITEGDDFTFTVTPDDCHTIGTVTVNGTPITLDANNSYTIESVTSEQTINIVFDQIMYAVSANAGNGGTVVLNGGAEVGCGENKTFTVTPDNCYSIATVSVNGQEVTLDANNSYIIENVTADQTINATFSQISYTIAASAGNGGTITPAGNVDVECGGSKTFAIAADEGYEIENVIVDGQSQGAIASYIFENVTENGHSIEATFRQIVVADCNAVTGLEVEPNAYGTNSNLLSWNGVENAESYSVYRNGVLVSTNSATSYFDTEGGQNIEYYVVTNCGNGNTSEPSATVTSPVTEQCNAVEGLEVSVEPYGNVLSWTAVENAVSYNIYRNDETSVLANVASNEYVDMSGNAGDRYHIVTICQYGESDSSDEVEAIPTAIDGSSISVELYPNPTDGKFMIECDEMVTVEIFNLVGQIVERVEASSNAITVDASAWTSGVYNVRITTNNDNVVVKQIVKQ